MKEEPQTILFCGETFPEAALRLARRLSDSGHKLVVCAEEEIARRADDADVLIPAIARIDAAAIERGRFGLIHQFGVGLETVDIEAATRCGVFVARVPSSLSGNAASVAEHAVLLMLVLSRRMEDATRAFADRRVGVPLGAALLGKTACIVGMGNIGAAVALRLSGFGMRLVAVDDHRDPRRRLRPDVRIDRFHPLADLPEAVAGADYIVACINYHAGLHHLFGRTLLSAAKPGAILVNIARGGLVDPDALLEALASGRIGGAGLDVFWEEPVDPDHPLFRENVVATPHIAGVTEVSYDGTAAVCADNIARYARGEPPLHAVNAPPAPRRRPR